MKTTRKNHNKIFTQKTLVQYPKEYTCKTNQIITLEIEIKIQSKILM